MRNTLPLDRQAFRRRILRWYDRNRRELPWRDTPENGYHQWVAEIMLQQTQVATALPYFNKFVNRFPTVRELSRSRLDEVMRMWAGLGYYARARNLHKSARIVVNELGGAIPTTVAGLEALPGIGRSTAGAIASIAFNRRAAVMDGNVRRVLSRFFLLDGDSFERRTNHLMWSVADGLLPRRRCGDFNQALMELGATICSRTRPDCSNCPLAKDCAALALGVTDSIPPTKVRREMRTLNFVVAAIEHKHKFLIQRRKQQGLWAGMWEMPSLAAEGYRTRSAALGALLRRIWPQPGNILTVPARPFARVTHQLTHRIVQMSIYHCPVGASIPQVRSGPRVSDPSLKWSKLIDLHRFAFARAQQKVVEKVIEAMQDR